MAFGQPLKIALFAEHSRYKPVTGEDESEEKGGRRGKRVNFAQSFIHDPQHIVVGHQSFATCVDLNCAKCSQALHDKYHNQAK